MAAIKLLMKIVFLPVVAAGMTLIFTVCWIAGLFANTERR